MHVRGVVDVRNKKGVKRDAVNVQKAKIYRFHSFKSTFTIKI